MSLRRIGQRVSRLPAMPVALLALFVSLFGTATAARVLINGKDIKNGSIPLVKLSKKARKQLTAHSRSATRADFAGEADTADTSFEVVDRSTASTVAVSSAPTPGTLLPLSANGTFPESVLPLDSTTKAPNVAARVYNSTDEPVPGGQVKLLTFDHVGFDTANVFDPAHRTRLKASVTGIYLITANVSWEISGTTGENRAVYVYVNGHAVSVDQRPPAQETRQVVTTLYRLNAGDEVEVGVAQDEASSLNANAVGDYAPSLAMAWIAPG